MEEDFDLELINEDFFNLVESYKNESSTSLLLSMKGKINNELLHFSAIQIDCRKKSSAKLKPFNSYTRFLFPDTLIAEQASDYRVSEFHASLIGKGKRILDMTAGLGIDAMTFALTGNKVLAIELNKFRCQILEYNAKILGISTMQFLNADSIDYLNNTEEFFDIIFVDPARRDSTNQRVYGFGECSPDITANLDLIKKHAGKIYIKASPMLDIKQVTRDLKEVEEIYITCVKGECKEIMPVVKDKGALSFIRVVDFDDVGFISDTTIEKKFLESESNVALASDVDLREDCFLYIPNAGMMKINAGFYLCSKFPGLKKISRNTHIYVSDLFYPHFPGTIHKIKSFPDKKALKKLSGLKYNVTARNYPLKADALKKKLNVKEGLDNFIIAFRAFEDEIPFICLTERQHGKNNNKRL